MKKTFITFCLSLALMPVSLVPTATAQERRDKEQTYVLETPYEVEKIAQPASKHVKNVILMIGDGMSLMHVYSAWTANRGKLWLENCPVTGLSKTYCANRLITDSGAGGTALATGYKTNYHSVGVDPEGNKLESLLALAKRKGLSGGVAVTCRLWDATPADFCCHNVDREAEEAIVADYPTCGADYVFGGGAKLFEHRMDGRNIFDELKAEGYDVLRSWDELEAYRGRRVFCVTDSVDTPVPAERGDLLARASLKGIDILDQNPNGFFMMIEGSQLDDYGHFNDLDMLMQEVHDFDRTVGRVLQWAAEDGETLVVITADHETGGLTLVDGDLQAGRIVGKFSTGGHSGVMVPVYAFGPGSERFTGIYENTDVFWKISDLLQLPTAKDRSGKIHYNAFSHNDYWRTRPLRDALDLGFNCVEADLWNIDGELYVSHEKPEARAEISFRQLYLEPLIARAKANGGKIYPDSNRPFYLMLDFKEKGESIYALLKKEMEPYKEYFCRVEDGEYKEGPILLFISGDRPMQTLPQEKTRAAFLDGKISELGKGIPTSLMPVVSDNYADFFTWKGKGEMSQDERKKMRDIIRRVHAEGKLFRWWGAPDTEQFKRFFLGEGVDLLGADDLNGLARIL